MNKASTILTDEAITLLTALIRLPSYSKEEGQTAECLAVFLQKHGVSTKQVGYNIIAINKHFDAVKPTLLLNSHHDTVKPNGGYTKAPFEPIVEDGKLYGLGSNDAGGCLVALVATFLHFFKLEGLKYNIILAATAEEEISGAGGIQLTLQQLPPIDCAIVGEPTLLQLAVAERGLVVLDAETHGKAGHAAREEGENAIYKAVKDIAWLQSHRFDKVSAFLGPVKLSVTSIETDNKAHNIVPSNCRFVIDARVNELYTLEEVVEIVQSQLLSQVRPRSTRLRSTSISLEHPLVKAGKSLGKTPYGSPTTSDKALMPFPALKVGPGDSARSHTADEFIYLQEISEGIEFYIALLNQIV